MLQAKLQQKARDQERAAAHPKRKITFVFIPLSSIGEEQVETLKDLEDDPNAAFFFDNKMNSGRRRTIRDYFGTTVPWLLCSATLPRHVKDEVLSSIKIKNPVEVVSDLDRPNCYYNILLGGGVDYKSGPTALYFLLDDCDGETAGKPSSILLNIELHITLEFSVAQAPRRLRVFCIFSVIELRLGTTPQPREH
ncbi:hypothetical protein V8E54_009907 [Elaphomyces granulatus]